MKYIPREPPKGEHLTVDGMRRYTWYEILINRFWNAWPFHRWYLQIGQRRFGIRRRVLTQDHPADAPRYIAYWDVGSRFKDTLALRDFYGDNLMEWSEKNLVRSSPPLPDLWRYEPKPAAVRKYGAPTRG